MFRVGDTVLDVKTGGTGLVINQWSDNCVEIDLTLPNGDFGVVMRNIADLERSGHNIFRRGRW